MLKGFKQFILRGNAVDLAIGVVIGAAFGGVVTALVRDLLTPLIGAMVKAPDFSGIYFTIRESKFMVGDFLNVLISFLIVAFTVYFFVVLPMNKLIERTKKEVLPEPNTKKCSECLSDIPKEAKRCAHCTSSIA